MQAQKEAPLDMQCKDKFLLQSVVTNPGANVKDITPEMVLTRTYSLCGLSFYSQNSEVYIEQMVFMLYFF